MKIVILMFIKKEKCISMKYEQNRFLLNKTKKKTY